MPASKTSFVASVLVRGDHVPPLPLAQQRWQEVVVVVQAHDEAEARAGAFARVQQDEACEYVSVTGHQVQWSAQAVAGIWASPHDLPDGATLFSRFLRATEAQSLLEPFEE